MPVKSASCIDILTYVLEDHNTLRGGLAVLRSRDIGLAKKREVLQEVVPLWMAHTRAEEEVVLSRILEGSAWRVLAMEALEEHELAELEVERVKQSADELQLSARLNVLGNLMERHLDKEEALYPEFFDSLSEAERKEMGMRYQDTKIRNELAPVLEMPIRESLLAAETGRIGYIIAWLLGVPVWILILVFMVRGH